MRHHIGRHVVVHTTGPALAGVLAKSRRGVLTLEDARDLASGVTVGTVLINETQVVMVQPVKVEGA
jgi:hypothetical protein